MNQIGAWESNDAYRAFARICGAIGRTAIAFGEGVAQAHQLYSDYEGLNAMSNRELAAMGISRGDIPAVVTGSYRREQPSKAGALNIGRRKRPLSPGCRTKPSGRRSEQMSNQTNGSAAETIDVRSLVPAQRHAKIFALVDELKPGTSFVLVNDHDPKPLYYQLEAEYPKQFSWTYVERGPEVWRVEIGKLAQAA